MFLVQMELAISDWIRSKNDREATNIGIAGGSRIQPQSRALGKKENTIPRVANTAAVRLQAPQTGGCLTPDGMIRQPVLWRAGQSASLATREAGLLAPRSTSKFHPELVQAAARWRTTVRGTAGKSGNLAWQLQFGLYILACCRKIMLESYTRLIDVCMLEYSSSSSQNPELGAQVNS